MTRKPESPGQIYFNVHSPELTMRVVPDLSNKRFDLDKINTTNKESIRKTRKPDVAYMNSENLGIIRERISFDGSDEQLMNKLVVFRGNPKKLDQATEIKLDEQEEKRKKYTLSLNASVIAQEILEIDSWKVPDGYKFYQLLGIYKQKTGTGMVSTDKATKKCASIQRSGYSHPSWLYLKEGFLAKTEDAIKVKKSKFEKTGFHWRK